MIDISSHDNDTDDGSTTGQEKLSFLRGATPGSLEAKKVWAKIDADAHSEDAIAKAQKLAGKKAVGMYQGKPLVPGEAGAGQGDFQFLVHKLMATKGYSLEAATKIAGKIAHAKYG